MKIKKSIFGKLNDNSEAYLYTLTSGKGMSVSVTNYGALITSIKVPDKSGCISDVVLGFNNLDGYLSEAYLKGYPYFGATIGRYSNRIARGRITVNGQEYQLSQNEGEKTLHGGSLGFDRKLWEAEISEDQDNPSVIMRLMSPDGDQGFPGNLSVEVAFSLTDENNLIIEYKGESDKDTVISLTNHSYFNLKGEGEGPVLDHSLLIPADKYLELTGEFLPSGRILDVSGTSLDFTEAAKIRDAMKKPGNFQDLGGYAHTWALDKKDNELCHAATLSEEETGRVLEIYTTEPGILFYEGGGLDGSIVGKSGKPYPKYGGLCLETQRFPDPTNHPDFPSAVLKAGEIFQSKTEYNFR